MARRDIEEAAEQYKGNGGEFFKLENDKDAEVVRFLIEEDLEFDDDWFIVHQADIEGKKRWVRCPETSDCPMCSAFGKPQLKLFLQLITKSDGKRKMWERGNTFVPKIKGLISKYGDLCNRPYEIQRNGKPNDTKTTYEIYPLDRDDKTLQDIPVEKQVLLGAYGEGFVLNLSAEDMDDVVKGRYRPEGSSNAGNGRGSERGGRDNRGGREERREAPPERRREKSGSDIF